MKLLIIGILFSIATSCNEKTDNNTKPSAPKTEIATTTITPNHKIVPGSHFYIIPPADFTTDSTTMQLKKEYANFMRMQFIGGLNASKYLDDLKVEANKKIPSSWLQETIKLGAHTVSIYHYKTAATMQYYAQFPQEVTDEMLVATYELSDAETGKAMYEALKTVMYKK
jgi:hypothetical protein